MRNYLLIDLLLLRTRPLRRHLLLLLSKKAGRLHSKGTSETPPWEAGAERVRVLRQAGPSAEGLRRGSEKRFHPQEEAAAASPDRKYFVPLGGPEGVQGM